MEHADALRGNNARELQSAFSLKFEDGFDPLYSNE